MIGALRLVLAEEFTSRLDHPVREPAGFLLPSAKAIPQPSVSPRDLGLTERQVEVLGLMMLKEQQAITERSTWHSRR